MVEEELDGAPRHERGGPIEEALLRVLAFPKHRWNRSSSSWCYPRRPPATASQAAALPPIYNCTSDREGCPPTAGATRAGRRQAPLRLPPPAGLQLPPPAGLQRILGWKRERDEGWRR